MQEPMPVVTLRERGTSRLEERRSVFIGVAEPAADEAAWRARVDALRAEHPHARHVAWALRLANGVERASDDGEPAATAGAPCLEALRAAGVTDAGVAVVRYFGGTLLGRGGLIRAYGAAAREAVAAAGRWERRPHAAFAVTLPYPDWPAAAAWLERLPGVALRGVEYAEAVRAEVLVDRVNADPDAVVAELRERTAGRAAVEPRGMTLYP